MQYLLYGGSGSGKSMLAETLAQRLEPSAPHIYLATMRPRGEDAQERIRRHRRARAGKGFITLEQYTRLDILSIPRGSVVILECLGNWVANEMFAEEGTRPKDTIRAVERGLATLSKQAAQLIVVSNDVSRDGQIYLPETQLYRKYMADLNRMLAARSHVVAETVSGIPMLIKGSCSVWDEIGCGRTGTNRRTGMLLVVGGLGAGKTEYVKSLGYTDADMSPGLLDASPVLNDLHELVRNRGVVDDLLWENLLQREVVVCGEIGCGVVPVSREEREYRDRVGRLCAQLAAHASRVVRLCCGIPSVIKG